LSDIGNNNALDNMAIAAATAAIGAAPDPTITNTPDLGSPQGVWGRQLGNMPQANIANFFSSISALEVTNVQPKYLAELASKNWKSYTHH